MSTFEEILKKYDVALYKRGSSYILHRIIGIQNGEYLIRGDNTYRMEHVSQVSQHQQDKI